MKNKRQNSKPEKIEELLYLFKKDESSNFTGKYGTFFSTKTPKLDKILQSLKKQ